jgi:hypothetical protein
MAATHLETTSKYRKQIQAIKQKHRPLMRAYFFLPTAFCVIWAFISSNPTLGHLRSGLLPTAMAFVSYGFVLVRVRVPQVSGIINNSAQELVVLVINVWTKSRNRTPRMTGPGALLSQRAPAENKYLPYCVADRGHERTPTDTPT